MEAGALPTRNGGQEKEASVPRSPTGPCLVSIIITPTSQGGGDD